MVLGEDGVLRWADATIRGYTVDRYADGEALRRIAAVVDARSPPLTDKKNRTLLDKLEELELEVKGARARKREVDYNARAVARWKTSNASVVAQIVELKASGLIFLLKLYLRLVCPLIPLVCLIWAHVILQLCGALVVLGLFKGHFS
jgi:hypothetical protein